MELKLFTYENCPSDLINVRLCLDTAPLPYDPSCELVAIDARSLNVYVAPDCMFPIMRAGRILAAHGIFKVRLLSSEEISPWDALNFLNALYDGPKHSLEVSLPFPDSSLRVLSWMFAMVSSARNYADLASAQVGPVALVRLMGDLCKQAAALAGGKVDVRVIGDGDKLFDRYSGLRAVGAGSEKCMGIIDFMPAGKEDAPVEVALCGKGITFDSGGYNIKPDHYMDDMRTDKTGAVNMAAALALAIGMGLKRRVRVYLPCAQNLLTSSSMLPGDIISYPDGSEVEVCNTDAEGRLVLADALLQAREDKAQFILDAATLTGSAKAAVGRDMCTVFTRDNIMPVPLKEAFELTGELFWQLPLFSFHKRYIKSRRATLSNSSKGVSVPGASAAAAFLQHFAGDTTPWVHIDLSSAYLPEGSPFLCAGPTGACVMPVAMWLTGERLS